ncbi:hypothetical protein EB796_017918 [Bugula neritina]|uniref:Uncharacterized protein n=1 Tax=Bugula neritina TaxID=10212 RepID=A0A7J7JDQ4_BUGNE|nr:hypothetical protein EB796_017918 [Bugula neritina]
MTSHVDSLCTAGGCDKQCSILRPPTVQAPGALPTHGNKWQDKVLGITSNTKRINSQSMKLVLTSLKVFPIPSL